MHSRTRAATLVTLASLAGCAGLEPGYGVEVPVASRYVYRGAAFNLDPVVQPDVYAAVEDDVQSLTLGVWSSFETSDENGFGRKFTEFDPYVDYGRQVGPVWASVGLTSYSYPNTGYDPTAEAYVILSVETGPVTTALETWVDFVEADGVYFNLNLGHEVELSERLTLSLLAGLGYMDDGQAEYYFTVPESGLSDAQVQATFAYALGEHVSISLAGAYSSVIDGDLRDATDDPDNAWVTIGTSFGF